MTAFALAEGGTNIISPNGSLVFVFILFFIFVFILSRLLFRPIGKVLDEREALTAGATAEARAATRQYQSRFLDYETSIRQARAESYRLLEQRRAAAIEDRNRLLEEAKQRAADEIERAKSEIADQTADARATLETESRQMAERISRTLLGRAVGGGAD